MHCTQHQPLNNSKTYMCQMKVQKVCSMNSRFKIFWWSWLRRQIWPLHQYSLKTVNCTVLNTTESIKKCAHYLRGLELVCCISKIMNNLFAISCLFISAFCKNYNFVYPPIWPIFYQIMTPNLKKTLHSFKWMIIGIFPPPLGSKSPGRTCTTE